MGIHCQHNNDLTFFKADSERNPGTPEGTISLFSRSHEPVTSDRMNKAALRRLYL
jgi:hypothetical protein